MNGILNILKPTGMTSHDVVGRIRKILNIKKVGHAGTLDPNVAGVLVICVGKGTKFSDILMSGDKEYVCELILGQKTDTQDSYGKVIESKSLPKLTYEDIVSALKRFEGHQIQIPPAYSAVKLNGKKLYEYARQNIEVDIKGKPVDIKEIKLLRFEPDRILFRVNCSKGTYMRTLCNDIGDYLNACGHMGILVRTKAKGLKIEDSVALEELKYYSDNNMLDKCLIPLDEIIPMAKITAEDKYFNKLTAGNEIHADLPDIPEENFYVYCRGTLVGIGHQISEGVIKINKLLM